MLNGTYKVIGDFIVGWSYGFLLERCENIQWSLSLDQREREMITEPDALTLLLATLPLLNRCTCIVFIEHSI